MIKKSHKKFFTLNLSHLPKTWLIDIDGVIFEHNGHLNLKDGEFEKPLDNVIEFFNNLNKDDKVILLSAREEKYRKITERSLKNAVIKYDLLIMGLPVGERILINDIKPDGLRTAYAINVKRNEGLKIFKINKKNKFGNHDKEKT